MAFDPHYFDSAFFDVAPIAVPSVPPQGRMGATKSRIPTQFWILIAEYLKSKIGG